MTALASAAVAYARQGIAVFPLKPRDKKPYGRTTGLHAALAEPEAVEAWWAGRRPLPLKPDAEDTRPVFAGGAANIGVATGPASGFWVLDLDGPDAEQALEALEAVNGPLPPTVEQATGNGRHLCFAWDDRFPLRNSAGKIGPKVDVRGDGGYIVAPPSIHPSGRVYTWSPGRSPEDLGFAPAPPWLTALAMPDEAPHARAPSKPRVVDEGRASRFGEACLATVCSNIQSAPNGQRQSRVWGGACFIGGLVGGGEIERAYARDALVHAALNMASGLCDTPAAIEGHVERGLAKGELHPRTAPERETFRPAAPKPAAPAASPAATAAVIRDARGLWDSARSADCGAFRTWLRVRGLDSRGLPGALDRLRAHPAAPIGPSGCDGHAPALLLPMVREGEPYGWGDPVDALAVLPLCGGPEGYGAERIRSFVGEPAGRVAMLTPWPEDGALLVALDLQDAWALGSNAHENGHQLGVVLAPTLRTFAGGFVGDRYGRVDPQTPHGDPQDPPWVCPGGREVWLAVRGDLTTPELRTRKTWGGTERLFLEGAEASRFYAGLAEQAWRRAGANAVRILRPGSGVGFNDGRRGPGR